MSAARIVTRIADQDDALPRQQDTLDALRSIVLPIARALGAVETSDYGTVRLGTPANSMSSLGVFEHRGCPVDVRAPFNRTSLEIQTWDSSHPVHFVRFRVRETDYAGTILADATVGVDAPIGVPVRVFADHATVNSASPLWVEACADGYWGVRALTTVPYTTGAGYPQARYGQVGGIEAPVLNALYTPNAAFDFRFALSGASLTEITPPSTWVNNSSTFTGRACPIGAPAQLDRVEFDVYAWDASSPITQVRVQIMKDVVFAGGVLSSSTILADKTIEVSPNTGVGTRIVVDLDQTILNPNGDTLYLGYVADGHTGYRKATSVVYSTPPQAYTTSAIDKVQWVQQTPATDNFYSRIGIADVLSLRIPGDAAVLTTPAPSLAIALPSMLYAVQGQEANLYFRNILRPEKYQGADWDLDVTSTLVGATGGESRQDSERYRVTPDAGDVGDSTLTLDAYVDAERIATQDVTVRTRGTTAAPTVSRKVLAIGDSTTAGGQWLAELSRLCAGGGITLTTVGTKQSVNAAASIGTYTVNHEGISGKDINWFYTDPTSPFISGGVWDFATYLTGASITMTALDWVFFMLGINDMFNQVTDTAAQTRLAQMHTQLDAMIANIRAAVAGVRVGVCVPIPPVYDQDGMGYAYGTGRTLWRYRRSNSLCQEFLIAHYDGLTTSDQYIVPIHAALDRRYNFAHAAEDANAYNATDQVSRYQNGVHPSNPGYWQIGGSVYAFMRGNES